jgi:hypothetical protein
MEPKANQHPLDPYEPTPWKTYDRITSIELRHPNGQEENETYTGICVCDRQIMGIIATFVQPVISGLFVTALGFAFIAKFLKRSEETNQVIALDPQFLILESIFLAAGILLTVIMMYHGIKARRFNASDGMGAIWINPEEQTLAIKDIFGDDMVLRFSQICFIWRMAPISFTFSGFGFKLFPRIFIPYSDDDGKKHFKIVRFTDEPDRTVHLLERLRFEYRSLKAPDVGIPGKGNAVREAKPSDNEEKQEKESA